MCIITIFFYYNHGHSPFHSLCYVHKQYICYMKKKFKKKLYFIIVCINSVYVCCMKKIKQNAGKLYVSSRFFFYFYYNQAFLPSIVFVMFISTNICGGKKVNKMAYFIIMCINSTVCCMKKIKQNTRKYNVYYHDLFFYFNISLLYSQHYVHKQQ